MIPLLLASTTAAIFAAAFTGRVWLILLACAYTVVVLGYFFWTVAP